MFTDTRKFNKEIKALKAVNFGPALHPLKKEQIKQAVLSRLHAADELSIAGYAEQKKVKFIRLAIPVSLGLMMLGGTAFAANSAKPGDVLFPVKKAAEQLTVRLTPTEEGKAKLLAKFAEERLRDLSEINNQAKINAGGSPGSPVFGQAQAQDEVKNALSELQSTQANLQATSNFNAAAVVDQTVLQLRTFLQTNEALDNNQDKSPKQAQGSQKAASAPDAGLGTGPAVADKKNKAQRQSSGNENTTGLNTSDNNNSGPQNSNTTLTPIISAPHNEDANKGNQGNEDISQGHTEADSSGHSAAHAAPAPANTSPPAVITNNSPASTGSGADSTIQNNPAANGEPANNQSSNNQDSGSQGGASQSPANQSSGSQASGNSGSGAGTSGGSSGGSGSTNQGSGGGSSDNGGSGNQNQNKSNGGSEH